jgi:hypothetical protein
MMATAFTDGREHVRAWTMSGLTQAEYCRQQGLIVATFASWRRRYADAPVRTQPQGVPLRSTAGAANHSTLLLPIQIVPDAAATPGMLLLRLAAGQQLELPDTVAPRWLAELLRCLG